MPLLHIFPLLVQFKHVGNPSSHFRCLSRHVRQPVLTRFGFGAATASAEPNDAGESSFIVFCPAIRVCILLGRLQVDSGRLYGEAVELR